MADKANVTIETTWELIMRIRRAGPSGPEQTRAMTRDVGAWNVGGVCKHGLPALVP